MAKYDRLVVCKIVGNGLTTLLLTATNGERGVWVVQMKSRTDETQDGHQEHPPTPQTHSHSSSKVRQRQLKDHARKFAEGGNVHEAVRGAVLSEIQPFIERSVETSPEALKKSQRLIEGRRREFRVMLEDLCDELEGKSSEEVAAIFSSFLNISSQLSVQKVESVISINCKVASFFNEKGRRGSVPQGWNQEVNLIFTVEEIEAVRACLETTPDKHPFKPFFTLILDMAFDVVQYNQVTAVILAEITKHFMQKLIDRGFEGHSKMIEFQERHDRTIASVAGAVRELSDLQETIDKHIKKNPVLEDLPNALRLLIQIRLGILPQSQAQEQIRIVQETQKPYVHARRAIELQFNRLPLCQHEVRVRHRLILNLQMDVLNFTAEQFKQEFAAIKREFDKLAAEIDTATQTLDPASPDYRALLRKKEALQNTITERRRELDILNTQKRLVRIQRMQVQDCLDRFQEHYPNAESTPDIQAPSAKPKPGPGTPKKKSPSRMATATFRRKS